MGREPVHSRFVLRDFKVRISKSSGSSGKVFFLKLLTQLLNLIREFQEPQRLKLSFFGAKLIALIKIDENLRPTAMRNTLRRFESKSVEQEFCRETKIILGFFS